MNNKIEEAQIILRDLGLPIGPRNQVSPLTLLALSGIKPDDDWKNATKKSMTVSIDIMNFVNTYYEAGYQPNSRESFRKNALIPFRENNIVVLNPDNPTLSPNSANTHYCLTNIMLETIKKFGSNEWDDALTNFKKHQFPENEVSQVNLKRVDITNFKSILKDTIELGRFNVFIGENGCGKSNILEALATISAATANDLSFDGLYSRGVRIARPDLMLSSFSNTPQKSNLEINLSFEGESGVERYRSSISPVNPKDIYTKWQDDTELEMDDDLDKQFNRFFNNELKLIQEGKTKFSSVTLATKFSEFVKKKHLDVVKSYDVILADYSIFDLNTKSLRGITPADSRKTPLGLNGEGLDLLISSFNGFEKSYLKKCETFFKWLESIVSDKDDKNKLLGLKPGRSASTLYFTDKFMLKKNNTLSAENSNEGILHVLFYLALFISNKTPKLFGIDNIESALNPKLCQRLIIELAQLSKERGKQVLITTHNPAVLDGLNLLDDEQRLFEVYRNEDGHTKTRRIKFKPDLRDKPSKLSEMWMKGLLGAVPDNF